MGMAEVPDFAVVEDDIELDLGLSIGGSFRKSPEKSISRQNNGCTDLNRVNLSRSRTTSGSRLTLVSDGDDESAVVLDLNERREIHALRRREAKRKRDEKQQRRGRSFGCGPIEDGEEQERRLKNRRLSQCNAVVKNVDLNLSDDRVDCGDRSRTNGFTLKHDPAAAMARPLPPLQCVPYMSGCAFPCVMPYWTTGGAVSHGNEKIVHQPVANRRFTPFQMNQKINGVSLSKECQPDGTSVKTRSPGSPVCSSSVVSDNYQSSSSHEGCSSGYTMSNSSISSSERHQTTSSLDLKPKPYNNDYTTQCPEQLVPSKLATTRIKEEVSEPTKPILNGVHLKKPKMENGKPPKPQTQSRDISSRPQMPCVSTTGIGPNGKTITGFLYRYSKSEVSILCVCHGESFSPAEFVKHAGGGQVSHPLRHITVLPAAAATAAANGIPVPPAPR